MIYDMLSITVLSVTLIVSAAAFFALIPLNKFRSEETGTW